MITIFIRKILRYSLPFIFVLSALGQKNFTNEESSREDGIQVLQTSSSKETKNGEDSPIQDNSFLVEEAYNQEDGVIQHISTFERLTYSRDWVFTQTDEWPFRTLRHQVSVTLAAAHAGDFAGSGAGWGDTAFNYRYQLVGSGETTLAIAPRISLLLPTGDPRYGRGSGGVGMQANLPISIQHSRHFVTHWNVGATLFHNSRNENEDVANTSAFNVGQSVVWLARPRLNFLFETVWISTERVVAPATTQRSNDLYLSPGVRWASNFDNGLQIVPGVAFPVGVGPCAGEKGIMLYLSFEHPLALAHSKKQQ